MRYRLDKRITLHKFILKIMKYMSIFVVGLLMYTIVDNDDLLYLTMLNSNIKGGNSRFIQLLSKDNDGDIPIGAEGGTTTIKRGSGLNLMLISKLNESYIKEMLSLYKDCEEGKLSNRKNHVSVRALLGMQVNETGTYNGTKIPVSYLPFVNGKIIWNEPYKGLSAKQMTLSNFGDKEWKALGGELYSWEAKDSKKDRTPWCIQGGIQKASAYNKTGKPDQHFLPDIINHVDSRLNNALVQNDAENIDFTQNTLDSITSLNHNRGENGAQQQNYGLAYSLSDPTGWLNSRVAPKKASKEIKEKAMGTLAELAQTYIDNMGTKADPSNIEGSEARYVAIAVACHTKNWFFGQKTLSYVKSHLSTTKKVWDALYPEENITGDEIINQVKKRVKTLRDAIKEVNGVSLSSDDTYKIYGTYSDYSDAKTNSQYGSVYRVTNMECTAYKNKYPNGHYPYLVNAYDNISAGQSMSALIVGSYLYAHLLKLGGVNIDPTNPDTYIQNVTTTVVNGNNNTTQKVQLSTSSALSKKYSDKGIKFDISKLTPTRIKILNAAAEELGNTVYGYGIDKPYSSGNRPGVLDCSRFVAHCYRQAGCENGGVSTSEMNSHIQYKRIAFSQMKPGDLLLTSNHVWIYVSGTLGDDLWVIDCGGTARVKSTKAGVRLWTRASCYVKYEATGDAVKRPNGELNDSNRTYHCIIFNKLEEKDKKELKTFTPSK